jgi:glycosyltransferase involved in cell wall biosynthesis
LHILYFHQHFTTPDGTGGIRSFEFAKELVSRGHRVTMVCGRSDRSSLPLPYDKDDGWFRGSIEGIDVIALPISYSNHDGVARRILAFMRYAFLSSRLALRFPCDVIFATSTPLTAAIPAIIGRWFGGKPFIFEVRDLWPELPKAMGMRNPLLLGAMSLLEFMAYRSSIGCIGLAPGIVDGIARRSKPGHPIAMIPNGCDLKIFRPELRGRLDVPGISAGDFVAGFTGAHGKANGLDAVLDAAAELKRKGNSRIKIVLVGDGSEKPRLMARARAEALLNVIFLPPVPKRQLATITASLDCGLMILANVPAFYDGTSPNKFFDYLSAGIPIVNNYPGWIGDIIGKYSCGLAVKPDSPIALAEALSGLANQPGLCSTMGINARSVATDFFDRRILAGQFVDFLVKTLEGRNG